MRGLARQLQGDHAGAIADATEAIRLRPEDAEAYFNRGNAYDEKREYAKALSDYNDTIRLSPRYPEAYVNRASVKLKTFDRAGGVADLKKALEVAPASWPHRAEIQGTGYDGTVSIELEYSPQPERIVEWVEEAYRETDAIMRSLGASGQ